MIQMNQKIYVGQPVQVNVEDQLQDNILFKKKDKDEHYNQYYARLISDPPPDTGKPKLWIFGDSFSDVRQHRKWNEAWDQEYKPYLEQLAENFDILNFSCAGSGPSWSLDMFYKQALHRTETEEIYVFFCLSSPHRCNLTMYETPEHQIWDWSDHFKDGSKKYFKNMARKYRFEEHAYRWFLRNFVFNGSSYIDTENLKIISTLSVYSTRFKKILAWPCFDDPKLYSVLPQNTNKFFVPDKPLRDCDYREPPGIGKDLRTNHLQPYNHNIIAEQITQHFLHDKPIDTSKFVTENLNL